MGDGYDGHTESEGKKASGFDEGAVLGLGMRGAVYLVGEHVGVYIKCA